jgi:hypothetical protein
MSGVVGQAMFLFEFVNGQFLFLHECVAVVGFGFPVNQKIPDEGIVVENLLDLRNGR